MTLAECRAMIDAVERAGVHLIVGHSHSFDAPYRRTREIIAGGEFGKLGMITASNFTDFMYRPRRPEELVTAQGGGVIFSQGAHQIDIVRLLGGGRVRSIRAYTGNWDRDRMTEGAYAALLEFEDGAFASAQSTAATAILIPTSFADGSAKWACQKIDGVMALRAKPWAT